MSTQWSDEQVRETIAQSYARERFMVPLSEIQKTAPRRRRVWISMAALTAAAAAVAGVFALGGGWRGDARPVGPGAPSESRPTGTAFVDMDRAEADCRSAGLGALQQDPEIPAAWNGQLPPRRVGLGDQISAGFVFADDRVMVDCVRYGRAGMHVGVVDISDGQSAPWTHSFELPTTTLDDDELNITFVVGWAPKTTTDIAISTSGGITASLASLANSSGLYYIASLPQITDPADITIVATTADSTITKVGPYPATSTPR
jgi:hypothetical protein